MSRRKVYVFLVDHYYLEVCGNKEWVFCINACGELVRWVVGINNIKNIQV